MLVAFEQRVDQTRITPANLLHLPTTVDRRKQEIRFLAEDSPKLAADDSSRVAFALTLENVLCEFSCRAIVFGEQCPCDGFLALETLAVHSFFVG